MRHILLALPCDAPHVGSVAASSFKTIADVETAVTTVERWQYPHFAFTDTKDINRHYNREERPGDRREGDDDNDGRNGRRGPRNRRRRALELGVRASGYRTVRMREFITVRDVANFLRDSDPHQSKQSNIPTRVKTITIGGPAAQRSQELRGVLQICQHIILKHIVPHKHRRHGDIHSTVEPILKACSPRLVTELELLWCGFKLDDVKVLQKLLCRFEHVERLTLRDLHLERNGIALLVQAVKSMGKLVYLDLTRNMMRRMTFPLVLSHINHPDTLTTLIIDNNNMERSEQIARIISEHKKLEVLRMRGMNMGEEAARVFGTLEALPRLRELDIGDNGLSAGCEHVASFVGRLKNLEMLSMDRCEMETPHALGLCANLHGLNLTHLSLAFNKLTPESGKAIASVVRQFPNLGTFELSGNRMLSEGVRPVLEGLAAAEVSHLEVLGLAQMSLDDAIAIPLTRVVRKSHKMRDLDISYNTLTSATILLLTPAFTFTPAMKIIDLRGNDIDHHVCDPLCGACKSMKGLEYLYMDGNDIDEERLDDMSDTVNAIAGMYVVGIGLPDFEHEEAQYRRTVSDAVRRLPRGDEEEPTHRQ